MEWSWPEVSETILGSSVNTVFVDNSATVVGGGVAYRGDGVGGFLVANCTFEGNTAAIRGGAVNYIGHEQAGSDPQQLVNNIFWNDSAPIGPEIGSMDSAGVTAAETTPWDRAGDPRLVGGDVDMGAFERQ